MIKKWLMFVAIALLLIPPITMAQTGKYDDEEVSFELVYSKSNLNIEDPASNLKFDEGTDALGGRFGYHHSIGKKDRRGNVSVGVELGLNFTKRQDDLIARSRGSFVLRAQANGNERIKPFVGGTAGFAKDNFKQTTVCLDSGGGYNFCKPESSEAFGAFAGTDIGKGRTRLRIRGDVYTTTFVGQRQWNAEISIGLVK
jgi:hypothetical protein